jgi:hypothetical protein
MKRTFIFLFALALALGLCLAMLTPVAANPGTTYYVSTTGSDETGAGSWYYPWKTIQHAIGQVASGDTIEVAPGTYVEVGQVVISKNLTIVGAGAGSTTVKKAENTGDSSSGNNRGWVLVNAGYTLNMSDLTLDGDVKQISIAILSFGTTTVEGCEIKNISWSAGSYYGRGVCLYSGTANVVDNTVFSNIRRIGVFVFGSGVNALMEGNTYTGKGAIDCLDYGIEIGGGGVATITGNTITNCKGVASVDNSTSAGILVTDYFGPGTEATITGNALTDNTAGIAIGYDDSDLSVATISGNTFENNRYQIDCMPDVDVDLEATLAGNTFDRAVVVRGSGIKVPAIFSRIQDAIDAASAGDTIDVYPGTYDQDEANDRDLYNGGAGTTDLNIFVDKSLTIQGVDEDGNPITAANDVQAFVVPERDTPISNLCTIFIQADNVNISGLDVTNYADPDCNFKTISVIGDNVTIRDCKLHAYDQVSCIYMYDPRYDDDTDTSYIQSYTFEDNYLDMGNEWPSGVRISSGPGWSGSVANRIVSGNTFNLGSYGIEFVGPGGDSWDVYPVGAATITDNSFSGQDKGSVVAWGKYKDAVGYGDLDWDAIFNGNSFDKSVIVKNPGNEVRYYNTSSGSHYFYYVRGIYSAIQRYPINAVAQAGDTIIVATGTYNELITINKALSLQGSNYTNTIIDRSASAVVETVVTIKDIPSGNVLFTGFKIINGVKAYATSVRNCSGASVITISDNYIQGQNADDDWGLIAGYGNQAKVVVTHNIFDDTYNNEILFEKQVGETEVSYNTFTGAFPTIYYMSSGGVNVTTPQVVKNNLLEMQDADPTWHGSAVSFVGSYYRDIEGQYGDGKFTNVTITENAIQNLPYTDYGNLWRGITLANMDQHGDGGLVSGASITKNTITGKSGNNAIGIKLFGKVINTVVQGNVISSLDKGVLGVPDSSGNQYPQTTALNLNSISGNTLAVNWSASSPVLDASGNWWGSTNPATVAGNISGGVDFAPLLNTGTDTDLGTPGFQPDLSSLIVHPLGSQTGSVGRIQEGVNLASGSTVNVAAGNYTESILIQKPLSVLGSGANQTYIDQSGNSSAGTVVTISNLNGNVTLSGFTIKTGPASTVNSNGIYVGGSGLTGGTITISDNVIQCWQSSTVEVKENYGLIAGYFTSPTPKLIFTRNTVYGGGSNPVLIERWAGPTEITNNYLYQCVGKDEPSDVIFMMNHGGTTNNEKQLISGNTFDMGWGATYDNDHRGAGVSLVGSYTGGTAAGGFTDVEICNNTLVNLKPYRRGITLWNNSGNGDGGNLANVVIQGNTISNAPGYTGQFGIRILGKATGTTITQNTISSDIDEDIRIQSWNEHNATGTVVHYNSLLGGVYGLNNLVSDIVDATYNWWGNASGPYHPTLNPSATGSPVSDNVLFDPWFIDEEMTIPVVHTTYKFDYEVPDLFVAREEAVVPVTFETDVLGNVGYDNVRFKFSATGPGDVIFKAKDSEEHEYTFVNSGFWGPSIGFNLPASYTATTNWTLNFSEPGEYTINFSLIAAPDGEVIAGIEGSQIVDVRAHDILDYYRRLHAPEDKVDTLDLLAAADAWIANTAPPGFDEPITTLQLLQLADEWFAS